MKDQFLGQVSHDLQVPLYCSKNFIDKSIEKVHTMKNRLNSLDFNNIKEHE